MGPRGFLRPYFHAGADDAGPGPAEPRAVGDLRPFLLTDGRVASADAIPIEAQVLATELGRSVARTLPAEQRDIVELCAGPYAVAEVAAHLRLHVGVVRVLVGDLARAGHVRAHVPSAAAAVDEQVLRRLIDGLKALR